jgi:hypothetical protein
MLASARLVTVISLAGMRISEDLVTNRYWCNFEAPGMFLAKGNSTTKKAEFHRIAADRRTRVFDLRTLDETKYHQALDLRVRSIYCPNNALLAALEGCKCVAVDRHDCL